MVFILFLNFRTQTLETILNQLRFPIGKERICGPKTELKDSAICFFENIHAPIIIEKA